MAEREYELNALSARISNAEAKTNAKHNVYLKTKENDKNYKRVKAAWKFEEANMEELKARRTMVMAEGSAEHQRAVANHDQAVINLSNAERTLANAEGRLLP